MADNPFDVFEEHDAQTERQRRMKDEEDLFREKLDASWDWLLEDRRGRQLIWFLLLRCGVQNISYTGQAMSTAFAEGRRDVGCWALNQILRIRPVAYIEMISEHDNDRRERAGNSRRGTGDRGSRSARSARGD